MKFIKNDSVKFSLRFITIVVGDFSFIIWPQRIYARRNKIIWFLAKISASRSLTCKSEVQTKLFKIWQNNFSVI